MLSVLVIDDQKPMLEVIRLFLERFGNMNVKAALSAKEALEILMSSSFDAMVVDYDLPEINGDASQLHQVLVNLVVNAIQAMPAGGTLTVSTRRDDPDVILTVEDTGSGMDDQVLRQIFIPFFTTKQVGQGTGLGLSVVHGIVTSHGGTVQVRSQIGHGSCFEVRLPTGQVPDTHAEHR